MRKFIVLLFFLQVSSLTAHEINTTFTEIEIKPNAGRLSLDLVLHQPDLAAIFKLPPDGSGIDSAILDSAFVNMQAYFREKYTLAINGETLELNSLEAFAFKDELGKDLVRFRFEATVPEHLRTLTIHTDYYENLIPLHKNLVLVKLGEMVQQAVLSEDFPEDTFPLDNPNLSIFSKSMHFVWLGIEHIFIGYDHILFLLGVILLGGKFINLVKLVTAFTIAHSLTLILAALQVVVLPPRFIESLIALSIVYIAAENFFVKNTDQRWMITFIFGLIHGFGFAGVLTELGLPQSGLVAALLSFNIGVEIGQIVIVGLLYPLILIGLQPRWQKAFVYGVSSVILVFGLLWFVERAFNVPVGLL